MPWRDFVEDDAARIPPPELVAEAKRFPGDWVYEVAGGVEPSDRVPPDLIVGAWAVDDSGALTGEFVPNLRFRG